MASSKKRSREPTDSTNSTASHSQQPKKSRTSKSDSKKDSRKDGKTNRASSINLQEHYQKPDVLAAFAAFSNSLATLLSPNLPKDALSVLTPEESGFLNALNAMKESGDIPWLPAPPRLPSTYTLWPALLDGKLWAELPNTAGRDWPLDEPAAAPNASWPPPLPPIHDAALLQQVFTHPSTLQGEDASAPGVERVHYQRLEFLGDAYLQSTASHILYGRFPDYREGGLSEMRQNLVSNKPLYAYAKAYGMETRMRTGRNWETNLKAVADCFEAYIGAVILDAPSVNEGLATLRDWLGKLFEPKIKEMAEQRKTVSAVDKMAKQTLYTHVGGRGVTVEYKWTDGAGGNKGGYWITVILNGWGWKDKFLGKGWGASKS